MSQRTVLIVEDDLEFQELLKLRVESCGHRVLIACSGSEGLDTAQSERPDLVILDVFLPDMDGLTVLKRMKAPLDVGTGKPSVTKGIPVVVITGKAPMIENITRVEGASDFFVKPVDLEELAKRVNEILEQEQYEREQKS